MEPSLNIAYNALMGEVGFFLGWGRGAAQGDILWSPTQQKTIDSVVSSGMRRFYYPAAPNGMSINWSFLKPTATFTLTVGANVLPLPDDFGGIEGEITILGPNDTTWFPIQICNEGQIRVNFSAFPVISGRPLKAAVQPIKGTGATQSQRFQLFYFPTADTAYTIQFQYYINPDYLTGAFPYAYGGPPHAETLLESCLAVAEQKIDDASAVHSEAFQERLIASAVYDNKMKAQILGYNGDNSDYRGYGLRTLNHYDDYIRFNGILYTLLLAMSFAMAFGA